MDKKEAYKKELNKLNDLFIDVDESTKQLAEGLILEAAFLFAENFYLRSILESTGMVKINPNNPLQQKTLPLASEYRKNLNSYTTVIKSLESFYKRRLMMMKRIWMSLNRR
jgi:hypothetical protein